MTDLQKGNIISICDPYVVKTSRRVMEMSYPFKLKYQQGKQSQRLRIQHMENLPKQLRDYVIGMGLSSLIPKSLSKGFIRYRGGFTTEWNDQQIPFLNPAPMIIKHENDTFTFSALANEPRKVNIVMELGGEWTLENYIEGSRGVMKTKRVKMVSHFRSILFQVLHTLHVLQKHANFQHNDLHMGNIILASVKHSQYLYHGGNIYRVKYFTARITDFELSDATFPAYKIFNAKLHPKESFDARADVHHLYTRLKGSAIDLLQESKFTELLQGMSTGNTPDTLMKLPFFDSLKMKPN